MQTPQGFRRSVLVAAHHARGPGCRRAVRPDATGRHRPGLPRPRRTGRRGCARRSAACR
ncbi:hypothetical protein [Micromonospora aurantiaca (nom. illeg.)]|uniref:hypothetical protein n=1 Tax=Micromonospora aurantiaca (nom. illeg.) TaxID=47850 RepID=UPI003F4D383E